jgi:uncharacterized repeat protein (TIGR02543 family)
MPTLVILRGSAGGTTDPPPGMYDYPAGLTVTVTATPDYGYAFNYWLLDNAVKTENPINVTMNTDHTLIVYFRQLPTYTLTVAVSPPEGGDTLPSPGTYTFPEGQVVSFSAMAASGYAFDHWTLNGTTSTDNPIQFTIDKDYTLTAYFTQPPATRTLTIAVSPTEGGTTDPSPGMYDFPSGSAVQVTAIPASGYVFDHWTLNGSTSTDNPITVTMDKDYTLTAYFVPTRALTVAVSPPEGGDTLPSPGTYVFPEGQTVSFSARPASGYVFNRWTLNGATSTDNPIQFTIDKDYTLTAYFTKLPTHTLTIQTEDPAKGTTDPSPGAYNYAEGSAVQVTAVPASGYVFDHWTLDSEVRTENPITITIDKDYTLTAYFTQTPTHTLTIAVSPPEGGTTNPSPGTYTYPEASAVQVTATPNSGYVFDHWTLNGATATENPITIYMDKDYTLTAYFRQLPPPEYATLTGTVTGLFGRPVSGVKISLDALYSAVTDASGKYTIQNIKPGNYTLTTSHTLYEPKIIAISLPEAKTYTVDITLQLKRIIMFSGFGALSAIVAVALWASYPRAPRKIEKKEKEHKTSERK